MNLEKNETNQTNKIDMDKEQTDNVMIITYNFNEDKQTFCNIIKTPTNLVVIHICSFIEICIMTDDVKEFFLIHYERLKYNLRHLVTPNFYLLNDVFFDEYPYGIDLSKYTNYYRDTIDKYLVQPKQSDSGHHEEEKHSKTVIQPIEDDDKKYESQNLEITEKLKNLKNQIDNIKNNLDELINLKEYDMNGGSELTDLQDELKSIERKYTSEFVMFMSIFLVCINLLLKNMREIIIQENYEQTQQITNTRGKNGGFTKIKSYKKSKFSKKLKSYKKSKSSKTKKNKSSKKSKSSKKLKSSKKNKSSKKIKYSKKLKSSKKLKT